jgi:protocatechuate 3,4-dioxygenase, alpha subunit
MSVAAFAFTRSNPAASPVPPICCKRLITRIYFPDEPLNAADAVLNTVASERRSTLVARIEDAQRPNVLRFDIVLQGENETVFFDV